MKSDGPTAIIIIPSRYASVRLPKKPLALIAGVSLVERVYRQCSTCSAATRVVVATDHPEIEAAVRAFGGEVVMTSPDCASGTDRIEEAARALGVTDEIVINVQGDEPLITPIVIESVIRVLQNDASAQVATAVSVLAKAEDLASPNAVKAVLSADGTALYFSRAAIPFNRDIGATSVLEWTRHTTYYKHIGIYGYRMPALAKFVALGEGNLERTERLEQLRFLEAGISIKTTLVDYDSVAVDTAEDIRTVELILEEKALG